MEANTTANYSFVWNSDSLEVLSMGRNQIKKLEGLEDVSATLKELWMSYNLIEKFNGIEKVPLPVRLLMLMCRLCV